MENIELAYNVEMPVKTHPYTNRVARNVVEQFLQSGAKTAMINAKSVYSGPALKFYEMCYCVAKSNGKCKAFKRGVNVYFVRADADT